MGNEARAASGAEPALPFAEEADERIGELDPPSEFRTGQEHRAWVRGTCDALRIIRDLAAERGV